MKNLIQFIQEGIKINSKSKINTKLSFNDDELRHDYNEVSGAYTKAEKQVFAKKYEITSNKIREIQLVILDYLRENRLKKNKFTNDDVKDFLRYDLPEKYDKLEEYLNKEQIDFIKYVLEYYKGFTTKISKNPMQRSMHDKYILKRVSQFEKYLSNN